MPLQHHKHLKLTELMLRDAERSATKAAGILPVQYNLPL